ncbi:MAG: CHAT domain-containing protein [Acidobacteria bacterium]|nr:CHAT domain-containing protein [Acidobacteriota bacterium]
MVASLHGCSSAPAPEALFAEAEGLRRRYEESASRDAIAKYGQAMAAWKQMGDNRGAARAGQGIGTTYWHLGLLAESVRAYRSALPLARAASDPVLESEIGSSAGIVQAWMADRKEAYDDARGQCQQSLDLARQAGSQRARAKALNCLGEVDYFQFRLDEALRRYLDAGRLWDELGDRAGQAQTLRYQGYVYSDQSRFAEAHERYERAQSIWLSLGDRREQAITLVSEARLRLRQGEYQEALIRFQSALELLRPMGDAAWEGGSLTGIARVYLDMAEVDLALDYWERALQIFEMAGLKHIAVDILMSLGETYLASGDDARALDRFERGLALTRELGIDWWQAVALRDIGVVHLIRREPHPARSHLERSLEMQASLEDPRLEAQTRADLGEVHLLLEEPELAHQDFEDALTHSSVARDKVTEARGFFGLARTAASVGELAEARRCVDQALGIAESLRTATERRDLRTSFHASVYRYNELQMDVLMRLHGSRPHEGLAEAAFEASERARARSLLDRLAEAGVNLQEDVAPELLRRKQILEKAFEDWSDRQRHGGDDRALAAEYRDLEERYAQLQAEIRSQSPRYAALVQPRPLTLVEAQEEVLDEETLLLEYALGEERSYLWAVTKSAHTSYELPPRAEIEKAARRAYTRLTARLAEDGEGRDRRRRVAEADDAYWAEAARLSEVLLGPVAKAMAGKRIVVVADGALQYLPFAALPEPGARADPVPLIAGHEVVNLPSASMLAVLRREVRERRLPDQAVAVLADPVYEHDDPRLAKARSVGARAPDPAVGRDGSGGFPRLAATRREAAAIVAAATEGTTLRALGFDASRATALSPELTRYRIVHFATHGVFDDENPGHSGIVLSMFDSRGRAQDGFLRLHDIYGLDLPAEMVVLSACDTALGEEIRGEGLVGMVRGFMHAGAERVVASLWKVDDEATGELMRRFYVEMLQNGRSPAAALRQAQLAARDEPRWRSPFYWAAFTLQGEWR